MVYDIGAFHSNVHTPLPLQHCIHLKASAGMKVDHVAGTVVVLCLSMILMHGTTGTLSKKDRGKKKKVSHCFVQ